MIGVFKFRPANAVEEAEFTETIDLDCLNAYIKIQNFEANSRKFYLKRRFKIDLTGNLEGVNA